MGLRSNCINTRRIRELHRSYSFDWNKNKDYNQFFSGNYLYD